MNKDQKATAIVLLWEAGALPYHDMLNQVNDVFMAKDTDEDITLTSTTIDQ